MSMENALNRLSVYATHMDYHCNAREDILTQPMVGV